jgi:hypothetical protein
MSNTTDKSPKKLGAHELAAQYAIGLPQVDGSGDLPEMSAGTMPRVKNPRGMSKCQRRRVQLTDANTSVIPEGGVDASTIAIQSCPELHVRGIRI